MPGCLAIMTRRCSAGDVGKQDAPFRLTFLLEGDAPLLLLLLSAALTPALALGLVTVFNK
jgi:hypothetical protein